MKAAEWVINQPWIITEEALNVVIAIAERRNESPEAVEAKIGRPLDNSQCVTIRDGVAVIPVIGPIARYADFFTQISGATAIDTLAKDFRTSLDDRSVKAIVLNMDSPGGTVAGVAEFASHVKDARGTKPIVCYVGSRAQSAAYWIASACDQIVADSTAMLGSIGVIMAVRSKTGSSGMIDFVSSQSPYKRVDPSTESGKAHIQATTDDLADVFVDAVASNRGVSREKVLDDYGQGGSFVGSKAVAAGMADGIGSLEGVIACLAKGEMPCPTEPVKTTPPAPARKADQPPRRAAMSEPNVETISAAEATELRKQLAAAQARADASNKAASDAVAEAISARADAFVSEFAGPANKTMYALALRENFVIAASDDHAHPIAGSKTHRQDKLRETVKAKPAPTKEMVAGDLTGKTRALRLDPADEPGNDPSAEERDRIKAEEEKFTEENRAFAVARNDK